MGSFISWFERSYKGIIVVLVAIMAVMLVILAMQHVNASKPAAGTVAGPVPKFTSTPTKPIAVFLGDSYTYGLGASAPSKRWSTLLSARERWTENNQGINSTGYVNPGIESGVDNHYLARLDEVEEANPAVVVISGGQNDIGGDIDAAVSAMQATIGKVHADLPDARLVIVGPVNPGSVADTTRNLDAAVRAEAGKVDATYVSLIAPSIYADSDTLAADGNHPTDRGHAEIAARVEAALG